MTKKRNEPTASLQLRVLGLAENRNVGISVFPEGEEILTGCFCLGLISGQFVCASEAEMSQRANTAMVDDCLDSVAASPP
jgi:hypothetical protein